MVGPGAVVEHSNLTVTTMKVGQFDLAKLAPELGKLRQLMREKDPSPEHDAAMAQIGLAEAAAKKGDENTVWKHLKDAGKIALEFAEKVGEGLAVEALKSAMGIPDLKK